VHGHREKDVEFGALRQGSKHKTAERLGQAFDLGVFEKMDQIL
jgi:hypothetical protein